MADGTEAVLAAQLGKLLPHLDERQQRLVLGAAAGVFGHGGVRVVARAAGVAESTVSRAVGELDCGLEPLGRVRASGAGRKRLADIDPGLVPALLSLIEPDQRGDPESPQARSLRDEHLTEEIRRIHEANYSVYGARKVHAALLREGHEVARCTVERLMRRAGLRGVIRAKSPRTTRPAPETARPADPVERAFTASAPNQLWVADITYIRTFSGWVYAAFVIDVLSRMVVGWQVATSLYTDLALDALEMAICRRRHAGGDLTGLIHHSDRGVQGGFK
ncbi:IS3 family transposase [Streptomyces sp. NPDC056227]|uniref:IS3 family transposase n=1 Tax=Streptomyces sp. NPDC056227 TaxID=3345753 RepID=UPI0035DCE81D